MQIGSPSSSLGSFEIYGLVCLIREKFSRNQEPGYVNMLYSLNKWVIYHQYIPSFCMKDIHW